MWKDGRRSKIVHSGTTKPIRKIDRFYKDCLKKTTFEGNSIASIRLVGNTSVAKGVELTSCLWLVES